METVESVLEDLINKQVKARSDLAKMRQNLCEKIEENFEIMQNQLKRNKEYESRMVENTLAEMEQEIYVTSDMTNQIIKEIEEMVAVSGKRMGLTGAKIKQKYNPDYQQYNMGATATEEFTTEPAENYERRKDSDMKEFRGQRSTMHFDGNRGFRYHQPMPPVRSLYYNPTMLLPKFDKKNVSKEVKNVKYSVKLHGTYKIRTDDDDNVCDVSGICCLENGGIILTDTKNACLKVMDSDLKLTNSTEKCNFIREPFGICHLRDEKYVFTDNTWRDGFLKYISLDETGSIKYIKAFSTGNKIWSIVTKGDNLYVIGRQKGSPYINRYTLNGGARLGGLGIIGEYMCFNSDKSSLYITRGTTQTKKSNDVTIVDHDELFRERCTFWHPELNVPCGVAVDEFDQLFICGFASKNVLQFDRDGNKLAILIEGEDALNGPKAIAYDKTTHRLIIAGNADVIKVFDLNQ